MKSTHLKTGVLVILVSLSMVLSYVLWQGNWQNTGSVSFTETPNLSTLSAPQAVDLTMPYQIAFTSGDSGLHTVGMPDSSLYNEWMKRLSAIRITNLHPTGPLSVKPDDSMVEYSFGVNLTLHDLVQWIPTLAQTPIVMSDIDRVTLVSAKDAKKPVQIQFDGLGTSYIGDVDTPADRFQTDVSTLVKQSPWKLWSSVFPTYLPATATTMQVFQIDSAAPSILPLVHSFFVNPQALTRIQESQDTVLWTDGSQVVWWNQSENTLTYADPNTSRGTSHPMPDIALGAEFLRNHGGVRDNTIIVKTDNMGSSTNYVFRTYINGLPILGDGQDYTMQLQDGRIVHYQRPLPDLTTKMGESTVKVMGVDALVPTLKSLMSAQEHMNLQRSLSVELGYYMDKGDPGMVILKPAYYISDAGVLVGILDAQTGAVLKGMTNP